MKNKYQYQPKGGMCATCVHRSRKCHHLPFDEMPIIGTQPNVRIVRCTEFKRIER